VARSGAINNKTGSGNAPLHLDFQFNHMKIVKFLLRKDADPTIKNSARLTPSELKSNLETGEGLKEAMNVETCR